MGLFDNLLGKPKSRTRWRSVRDKFFGGKEVVDTTVTEQGSKTQVEERRTHLRPDGSKSRVEHTKMGDDIE